MNKRQTGQVYEELAAGYLQERKVRILERNFRCRQGEIDIIGYDGSYLIFAEVKYRKDCRLGYAAEAVGEKKQRTICRTADYYRYIRGLGEAVSVRYDVIAIDGQSVEWIQDAFPHRC